MCKNCNNKTRRKLLSFVILGAKHINVSNFGWKTGDSVDCSVETKPLTLLQLLAMWDTVKFQTSLWPNVLLCSLGGHEGVTNRFAAFLSECCHRIHTADGKGSHSRTNICICEPFHWQLAPGAFVAGVTVLISAQPQLTTKPTLCLEAWSTPNKRHLGQGMKFYNFSDAVSGCRRRRVTRLCPHNLADGEWHAWPLMVENRIQGTTQQEVLQGSSAEQQFGQNDCRLMSTHCKPCGGAQISKSPSLAISPEMD